MKCLPQAWSALRAKAERHVKQQPPLRSGPSIFHWTLGPGGWMCQNWSSKKDSACDLWENQSKPKDRYYHPSVTDGQAEWHVTEELQTEIIPMHRRSLRAYSEETDDGIYPEGVRWRRSASPASAEASAAAAENQELSIGTRNVVRSTIYFLDCTN